MYDERSQSTYNLVPRRQAIQVLFCIAEEDNHTKIINSEIIIAVADIEEVTTIVATTKTTNIIKMILTIPSITTPIIIEVMEILVVIVDVNNG